MGEFKKNIAGALVLVLFFGLMVWISELLSCILEMIGARVVGYALMALYGMVALLFLYRIFEAITKHRR